MLKIPFFEFGPKAYLYGNEMIKLAEYADSLVEEFGVDIIIDPQTLDISEMVKRCKNIHVFAQHTDCIKSGRGMGTVLPEALKSVGAAGTFLNHAERRLSLSDLETSIYRCREAGLMTMVCADNPEQAVVIAAFSPDIIVVESPAQIGEGSRTSGDNGRIPDINRRIYSINKDIKILHAAGIKTPPDVYNVILSGSDASGSSSAIAAAEDPYRMFHDMVEAVRRAWNERNGG
ncbi:triose-phosphate isomerase [Spirochaetia bacterium]|nr:triose-phosphate isomerase [Spirochaetia bacterium]